MCIISEPKRMLVAYRETFIKNINANLATGEDTGEYLEKYTYSYPVWRCKQYKIAFISCGQCNGRERIASARLYTNVCFKFNVFLKKENIKLNKVKVSEIGK